MPVILGAQKQWLGSGVKRTYAEVPDEMMYIPIIPTIQTLLMNDEFVRQVRVITLFLNLVMICTYTSID